MEAKSRWKAALGVGAGLGTLLLLLVVGAGAIQMRESGYAGPDSWNPADHLTPPDL